MATGEESLPDNASRWDRLGIHSVMAGQAEDLDEERRKAFHRQDPQAERELLGLARRPASPECKPGAEYRQP